MKMKLTKEIQLPDARQIRVLSEDNRGNLWIGTENAIYQYSLSKGELKKFQGGTNMINGLAVAADGTIFCITEALEFQYFFSERRKTYDSERRKLFICPHRS